jgi:hypothetical protein
MDFTENYIKMCEKATEVQKQNPLIDTPNLNCSSVVNGVTVVCGTWIARVEDGRWQNGVWLPRQDQLQEMVINHRYVMAIPINAVIALLDYFQDWVLNKCDGLDWSYSATYLSMEQLWLAFAMREIYNKTWNGEDWIKEEING